MGKVRHRMLLVIGTLLLSSCAMRSAPSRFFTLRPELSEKTEGVPSGQGPSINKLSVGLLPIDLPEYLDGPKMVLRAANNEIIFSELERWAEPLKQSIAQILADEIGEGIGNKAVLLVPSPYHFPLTYRVKVEVEQCERLTDKAVFRAKWSLVEGNQKNLLVLRRDFVHLEKASIVGPEELVNMSKTALAILGKEIAQEIESRS